MVDQSFANQVVGYSAQLRGFARKLARSNSALADDLVQDTILRALLHCDQFRPGTNLGAWLHTILRNSFFNELRRINRFAVTEDNKIDAGNWIRMPVKTGAWNSGKSLPNMTGYPQPSAKRSRLSRCAAIATKKRHRKPAARSAP